MWIHLLAVLVTAAAGVASPQLLPAPGDGEIRTVYWELQNVSEVWLTLEPKTAKGERAPFVTFTYRFPGKRSTMAPREVEVRAFAGQFWAPRDELWFVLDDQLRIDLAPVGSPLIPDDGQGIDSWAAPVSIASLQRMAQSRRITGNALGFGFELTGLQREALRAFLDRITSAGR